MGNGSNIIGLVPKEALQTEPSLALIEWLEEMLEKAKTGELKGLSGACRFSDDECAYFVMGWAGGFAMAGALQMAAHSQSGIYNE